MQQYCPDCGETTNFNRQRYGTKCPTLKQKTLEPHTQTKPKKMRRHKRKKPKQYFVFTCLAGKCGAEFSYCPTAENHPNLTNPLPNSSRSPANALSKPQSTPPNPLLRNQSTPANPLPKAQSAPANPFIRTQSTPPNPLLITQSPLINPLLKWSPRTISSRILGKRTIMEMKCDWCKQTWTRCAEKTCKALYISGKGSKGNRSVQRHWETVGGGARCW